MRLPTALSARSAAKAPPVLAVPALGFIHALEHATRLDPASNCNLKPRPHTFAQSCSDLSSSASDLNLLTGPIPASWGPPSLHSLVWM